MSNIIKDIDFGMGYEQATEWEPGLSWWDTAVEKWFPSNNGEDFGLTHGLVYRRKLPILANHPEAIPLEPGEVLKAGEQYLTDNSRCTGVLSYTEDEKKFYSKALNLSFHRTGRFYHDRKSSLDIIARLPKVAKEAEKAKEEKVGIPGSWLNVEQWERYEHYGIPKMKIPPSEAARLYLENESVRAEVKRQEEAKRIGPGDWFIYQNAIYRCVRVGATGSLHVGGYGFARDRCRKLDLPPTLIAALNAEIDGKAGG